MPNFTRALGAMCLVMLGAAALVGRSIGQEGAVQKTSSDGDKRRLAASVVGTIDMDAVMKGYDKWSFLSQQLEADYNSLKAELGKIMAEIQQETKEMEHLQPTSPDYKNHDMKLTELRVRLETERDRAQREFAQRNAEAMATVLKEVLAMVEAVAKHNHINFVLPVSNEAITSSDPRTIQLAAARSVVWSDGSIDITNLVTSSLNKQYRDGGGTKPAAAPTANQAAPAPNQPPQQQPQRTTSGNPPGRSR